MIPQTTNLNSDQIMAKPVILPNKTYKIDRNIMRISSKLDGIEAIKQAVGKILCTERFAYLIYGGNYGVGLEKYIGKDIDYIKADIGRAIKDALQKDDRVVDVVNIDILKSGGDSVDVKFEVITKLGSFEQEVNIDV